VFFKNVKAKGADCYKEMKYTVPNEPIVSLKGERDWIVEKQKVLDAQGEKWLNCRLLLGRQLHANPQESFALSLQLLTPSR